MMMTRVNNSPTHSYGLGPDLARHAHGSGRSCSASWRPDRGRRGSRFRLGRGDLLRRIALGRAAGSDAPLWTGARRGDPGRRGTNQAELPGEPESDVAAGLARSAADAGRATGDFACATGGRNQGVELLDRRSARKRARLKYY